MKTTISVVGAATFAVVACSDREGTGLGSRENKAVAPSVAAEGPRTAAARNYAEAEAKPGAAEVDNTGRNVRDRDAATLTPADQSNSAPDIDLTQKIRKGITSNDAMSMQARNVKVITQDGVVTLRGPVKTQAEKESIEALAKDAGATRVDNQIEIDRDMDPVEKE